MRKLCTISKSSVNGTIITIIRSKDMPSRNTEKPITRKDIAELLGVSVSVVSRALNNSGYVEEKKRQKIIRTAEELG